MAAQTPSAELFVRQKKLVSKLQASALQTNPHVNSVLRLHKAQYLEKAAPLNETVRVFYLRSYLQPEQIPRLVTHVPYICTGGDSFIQLQSGRVYQRLTDCKSDFPGTLVNNEERRLSRKKSIASYVKVFASGGYPAGQSVKLLDETTSFDCVVVTGAGPQFEARYLDYTDFIVSKPRDGRPVTSLRLDAFKEFGAIPERWDDILAQSTAASAVVAAARSGSETALPAFLDYGVPDQLLHVAGYMASVRDCMHLWLSAFDALVGTRRAERCGYFKLVAIGTGFFADVAGTPGLNLGATLQPLLLRAAMDVLERHHDAYLHIAAVEFPDFSGAALYTPRASQIGDIQLVAAPYRDVLDFPPQVAAQRLIPGVLNPGDCFALVGNETSYGSVEAMIANNSTLRINQNYLWNELVLDESRYVPVGSF